MCVYIYIYIYTDQVDAAAYSAVGSVAEAQGGQRGAN